MPRLAANLTLLFNEHDFPDRYAAARAQGFRGVECLFPYAWSASDLAARLGDQGLTQVLFNLPAGDWESGERGIACLPGRDDEFRRGLETAVGYAKTLACKRLNCLAGVRPADLDPGRARDTLIANLDWAAAQLAREGIELVVEAINSRVDMPGFLLDTSASALAVMDAVGSDNLRLQYDIYHMQIMEGDILRTLACHLPRIGHIQFADNPGRHEPGTGELNYERIFEALDEMGYDGWVSAEYRPSTTTVASLKSLSRWLGAF
ncbi:hydroxypyruvate isomerase [Mangrovitalea sediminis]|uniref:hydroxypyruvate isomerase n=1 Tax=Mangrovitalea sediminis TaxID=1982043 RepID=UPI000BE4B8EE|nr:hydroxypyruvate isomerase [Mangrovitalea sediminis]